MKSNRAKPLTESQLGDLLAIFATAIGLLLRLAFPLTSSFPLNDGGLFYGMIRDLQANHYILPAFTTYNRAQIPFAYPPLAFYIAGLLSSISHIDLLILLRLLPPIISAAAIPVFYFIAKEFLQSKSFAGLAALLFALTERVFDWHIMGGGITRSFGFLFALLTIYSATKLFSSHATRFIFWTSICAALTILTHPEAIPQTALAAAILYLFMDRSRKGLMQSLLVAASALILAAPWWVSVLYTHGLDPFIAVATAAGRDSNPPLARPVALFQFSFTDEPFLPLVGVLGLIGAFQALAKRKYFLPLWLILPYLLEPRSGPLYMMIPLLLLATQALGEIILPALNDEKHQSVELSSLIQGRVAKGFIGFLFIYLLIAGYFAVFKIYDRATLTETQTKAMAWVRENTPPNSSFLLITGEQPLLDPASDWFPALTERKSLATVFGYEWVHDGKFAERVSRYISLQVCAGQTAACLEKWSKETGIEFTYVYIQAKLKVSPLQVDMANSSVYMLRYQDDGVWVFEKTEK